MYPSRYERMVAARRRALSRPWPWRLWAYAFWLVEVLPVGPSMVVALATIFATMGLVLGLLWGLMWLWNAGAIWVLYVVVGWYAPAACRVLWRGLGTLTRAILVTEREYRRGPDGKRLER